MRKKYGFTLVEMLFVVIIAGAVIAMSVPAYKRAQERAKYNAALGQLSSFGGAIQSLNADLALSDAGRFPFSNQYKIISVNGDFTNRTLKEALAEKEDAAEKDNLCLAALYLDEKYHAGFSQNTGYTYWAVNGVADGNNVCGDQCKAGGELVCMCKTGAIQQGDCYYGAKYFRDGTVRRMRVPGCNE